MKKLMLSLLLVGGIFTVNAVEAEIEAPALEEVSMVAEKEAEAPKKGLDISAEEVLAAVEAVPAEGIVEEAA